MMGGFFFSVLINSSSLYFLTTDIHTSSADCKLTYYIRRVNTALRCVITVPVERIGLFMCPEEQVGLCLGVSQNMANGDVAVILHLFFFFFCNVSLIKKCVSSANIKVHC